MPSLLSTNPTDFLPPKVTRQTVLSKKSQLMLLSERAKTASKEAAAEREKEQEEERMKKQAEINKREQRAADRKKKQDEEKKKQDEATAKINNETTSGMEEEINTNKHLAAMNDFDTDLDINMNDDDIFDFSQDDTRSNNLFGEDSEDNNVMNSPLYKRGKTTGGGVLKGSHRYSTGPSDSVRKTIPSKPTTYQFTKFVDIGILLESEEKATECIMNLKNLLAN